MHCWWGCFETGVLIHATAAKSLQSCPTLCDPIDGSPPASPVPGILQARTLEWVASSFSNAWKWKGKVKSLSRVWLRDPMDYRLPGSSVHGILQARVLEWGAIAFSFIHANGSAKQHTAAKENLAFLINWCVHLPFRLAECDLGFKLGI